MKILGIDPGSHVIGHGLITVSGNKQRCLDYGVLRIAEPDSGKRLARLYTEVEKLLIKTKPDCVSLEKIFFFKNSKTVIPVAESRGVIALAIGQRNIPIYEFTPLQIKSAVSSDGRAGKMSIQKMTKLLLNLDSEPQSDDAADALASALCCAYALQTNMRF